MAIRYTKDYNREIARVVENYNKRVRAAAKSGAVDEKYIPSTVSVRELKQQFDRRSDLNRKLKSLSRFDRKSLELVSTKSGYRTKYELGELKRSATSAKRLLSRRISSRLDISYQTAKAKKQAGTLYDDDAATLIRQRELLDTDLLTASSDTYARVTAIINNTVGEEAFQQFVGFKNRFVSSIYELSTMVGGWSKLQELADEINGMSDQAFYRAYQTTNLSALISRLYNEISDILNALTYGQMVDLEPYENDINLVIMKLRST